MELFHALGLDIRILIAQFINFAVLIFVLYRFMYQPVLDLLEERKKGIDQGLKNANLAEEQLKLAREESSKMLAQAKQDAQKIIEDAHGVAKETSQNIVNESQKAAEKIVEDGRKKIQQEKERIMEDIRADVTRLVVLATEKVLNEKLDASKEGEIIRRAVEENA